MGKKNVLALVSVCSGGLFFHSSLGWGATAISQADILELKKLIEQQQLQIDQQAQQIRELKSMLTGDQKMITQTELDDTSRDKAVVEARGSDVQVQLYGHLNRAVLAADNGDVSETYFVDNANSQTRIGINASATVLENSRVGGNIEYGVKSNSSTDVNQLNTNDASDVEWNLRHADIFFNSPAFGKFSLGKGSIATDNIEEIDLSGTAVANYSDLSLMAGGILFFDEGSGALSNVRVKDVFTNLDGGREDRFRYDTPDLYGFTLSGAVISGDSYDAALRYSREFGKTRLSSGIGWLKPGDTAEYDYQVGGSFSVLFHSGVNFTFAGGIREFDESSRDEGSFFYGKIGYRASLIDLGRTSFSLDYGMDENIALDGDEAASWSLGVVQALPSWGTELYLVYRQYELDREGTDFDLIDTFMGGARVKF